MNELRKKKTTLEKFFTFDKIALMIGFIVDTITLISILLSFQLSNGDLFLPTFVTPWFALGLWALGEYIYLSLLHSYWQKNIDGKSLQPTFGGFLINDLVLGFHNPVLSFLGLISAIVLIWIAFYEPVIAILAGVLGVFVFTAIFAQFMVSTTSLKISSKGKQKINANWEYIKKRIKERLSRKQWVSYLDLDDIATLWDIEIDDMVYALAKYATENPSSSTFGEVFRREDQELASGTYSVLINLKNINRENYYYTG